MSDLLAISFDSIASPALTLNNAPSPGSPADRQDNPFGWGVAWYAGQELVAEVVKDITLTDRSVISNALKNGERFSSTIFVSHLRGAAGRRTLSDTQPFERSYAGRSWIFAHNGDLQGDWRRALVLAKDAIFEPAGHTDSEHIFCWLLNLFQQEGVRSLADIGWERLHSLFSRVNELGTLNVILADGQSLAVYHDRNRFNGLHWLRKTPPHRNSRLKSDLVTIELDSALDGNRTALLFSSRPLSDEPWAAMGPGHLLVARRGAIHWDDTTPTTQRTGPRGASTTPSSSQMASPSQLPIGNSMAASQAVSHTGASPTASPTVAPAPTTPATTPGGTSPVETAGRGPIVIRHARTDEPISVMEVEHETVYRYAKPVERSSHIIRLRPVVDSHQRLVEHTTAISVDGEHQEFEDVFGNHALELTVTAPYTEFAVRAQSIVEVRAHAVQEFRAQQRREQIPQVWMPWQRQMMLPYLLPTELPESELRELSDFAMGFVVRNDHDLLDTLTDINRTIYQDFTYVPAVTTLETTPFDVFATRRGVCQDFANLLICLARLLGVPARYRVGYIDTHAEYYENRIQSDASHAWAEVFLPKLGWRGLDPTNGGLAGYDHIRIACGRNYRDATPTMGTIFKGGGGETLGITVRVKTLKRPQDRA